MKIPPVIQIEKRHKIQTFGWTLFKLSQKSQEKLLGSDYLTDFPSETVLPTLSLSFLWNIMREWFFITLVSLRTIDNALRVQRPKSVLSYMRMSVWLQNPVKCILNKTPTMLTKICSASLAQWLLSISKLLTSKAAWIVCVFSFKNLHTVSVFFPLYQIDHYIFNT